MNKTIGTMLMTVAMVAVGLDSVSALTPEQLGAVFAGVTEAEGDAVILDVTVESSWDEPILEVELDNGWEVYVATAGAQILRRERDLVGLEGRRIAAAMRAGEVLSLDVAWDRILEQLESSERFGWLSAGDLDSIGYDIEFRRPVVEVEFRPRDRERVSLYADAASGEILGVEHDD